MGEESSPSSDRPSESAPDRPKPATTGVDQFEKTLGVVGTVLTLVLQVKLFIEQQWAFAAATLLICIVGVALYAASRQRFSTSFRRSMRIAGVSLFTIVPIIALAALYEFTIGPRALEEGPIMAIARFQGPTLPPPYENCRPSDMLTDALADVGERYSHLNAFELPYVIDPNGRWAKTWAFWHGLLEGADTIVYGEYSLVDNVYGEHQPDRLLISPAASQVPIPWPLLQLSRLLAPKRQLFPLGPKTAPLQQWDFPDRVVRIDELCTGHSQRLLGDGRRLALAIVGLQAFAAKEYVAAERALSEAEEPRGDDPSERLFANDLKNDDSRCDSGLPSRSKCSGVLAFYLAALEQRMGHYDKAEREYKFAAGRLNRSVPYVNLAELYVLKNEPSKALQALKSAESAEPTSLVAAATLARYEFEYGYTEESKFDLYHALRLASSPESSDFSAVSERDLDSALAFVSPSNEYGWIALCRAIHARSEQQGLNCRARVSRNGYGNSADAEVEYGRWLMKASHQDASRGDSGLAAQHRAEGLGRLRHALKIDPSHIAANYNLALALSEDPSSDKREIRELYRYAVNARAFTDDEFTNQGNAAVELREFERARLRYDEALKVNSSFAYAYSNRGALHVRLHEFNWALRDMRLAATLHPKDCDLKPALATLRRSQSLVARREGP